MKCLARFPRRQFSITDSVVNQERSPELTSINLAIVVVNYHCTAEIKRLLDSIGRSLPPRQKSLKLQVWIVNNSPDDQSLQSLPSLSPLTLRIIDASGNVGFGRACNLAIAQLWHHHPRPWIWLLNPDTTVGNTTLQRLGMLIAKHHTVPWAIAGTGTQTPDGRGEFSGGHWDPRTGAIYPLREGPPTDSLSTSPWRPTAWVSGCSLILNPNGFGDAVPQFDPDFFLYYEDFELCRRYAKQRRSSAPAVVVLSDITITHHTSSVIGRTPPQQTAWAIEGYLFALEKCAPRRVWLVRLVRIAIAALMEHLRGNPSKGRGLIRYLRKRCSPP